jgi:hypothetical protein
MPPSSGLVVVPFAPAEVMFLFLIPQLADAHQDREEWRGRRWWRSLPVSPRLKLDEFFSPL